MRNPLLLLNRPSGPPRLLLLSLLPAGRTQAQFGPAATFTAGFNTFPEDVATADFNGDGKPDVLLSLGGITFGTLVNPTATNATAASCAAALGNSLLHVTHPL
jgi:hypothetical protein